MSVYRIGIAAIFISLTVSVYASNPFLDAKDGKPVSANFRGTEWNDQFPEHEIPLTARSITTRIAKMPWGAIFKIEFTDLKSRAPEEHEVAPTRYYINRQNSIPVTFTELRLVNSAMARKVGFGTSRFQ